MKYNTYDIEWSGSCDAIFVIICPLCGDRLRIKWLDDKECSCGIIWTIEIKAEGKDEANP